jgi:hypothetical protein
MLALVHGVVSQAVRGRGQESRGIRLKVYRVEGIHRYAVISATSSEESVVQAVEHGLVGEWEASYSVEVPLPPDYYLAYDPLLAAEQLELPLLPVVPEPDKPHTIGLC